MNANKEPLFLRVCDKYKTQNCRNTYAEAQGWIIILY